MNSSWQNADFKSLKRSQNFSSTSQLQRYSNTNNYRQSMHNTQITSSLNPFAKKIDSQNQLNTSFGNIQQSHLNRNDSRSRIYMNPQQNNKTSVKKITHSQSVDRISLQQKNSLVFSDFKPFLNKNLQQIFTPKKVKLPPPRKNNVLPIRNTTPKKAYKVVSSTKDQNIAKNYQSLNSEQKYSVNPNLNNLVSQRLSTTYQRGQINVQQNIRSSVSADRQRKSVPIYYSRRNQQILKVELVSDRNYQLFRKAFNPEQYNYYEQMKKIVDTKDEKKPSIYHQVESYFKPKKPIIPQRIQRSRDKPQSKSATHRSSISQNRQRLLKSNKNPLAFNLHVYHKEKKQSLNYITL